MANFSLSRVGAERRTPHALRWARHGGGMSRVRLLSPGHPSDWCPLTPCQGRGQARLRVYVCQAASTVRGCPAVTDGLDGELARLQDQGTGGMAPLATPRISAGLAALRPSGRSPRVRREPGAAVARQGLRAAGPAAGSVPGSPKVPSQLRTVNAPRSGQCSRSAALLHVRWPARAARSARP